MFISLGHTTINNYMNANNNYKEHFQSNQYIATKKKMQTSDQRIAKREQRHKKVPTTKLYISTRTMIAKFILFNY